MASSEKTISVLLDMIPGARLKNLDWTPEMPITQVHFFTDTHECSVTDFSHIKEQDRKALQRSNQNDNDIVWIGNFRFSATMKV